MGRCFVFGLQWCYNGFTGFPITAPYHEKPSHLLRKKRRSSEVMRQLKAEGVLLVAGAKSGYEHPKVRANQTEILLMRPLTSWNVLLPSKPYTTHSLAPKALQNKASGLVTEF